MYVSLNHIKIYTNGQLYHLHFSQEYELITKAGQCCGECVQTKCKAGAIIYDVGNMWKSEDGCTFFECVSKPSVGTRVSSYKKSCPPLPACQRHNIIIRDCCEYCSDDRSVNNNKEAGKIFLLLFLFDINWKKPVSENEFIHNTENMDDYDPATYANHQCARECRVGAPPMICKYTFHVSRLASSLQRTRFCIFELSNQF